MFAKFQSFKRERLASSLKAAIAQLERQKKIKSQRTEDVKKEIVELLRDKKDLRAQVRVEHIIQEDNLMVVMEQIQLLCELLYKKIGLIQANKDLEESLNEAVVTLIWAAPHLEMEVTELKKVSYQLCLKYSQEFGNQCRANKMGSVNTLVIEKLAAKSPSRLQVEKYLCDIAKEAGIEYQSEIGPRVDMPDRDVFQSLDRRSNECDKFIYPGPFIGMPTASSFQLPVGRPVEGKGLPYPEKCEGLPDVGEIMKEMGIHSSASKGSTDISMEPSKVSEPLPHVTDIGFKSNFLKDSEDSETENENLPDVTSAQPTNSVKSRKF